MTPLSTILTAFLTFIGVVILLIIALTGYAFYRGRKLLKRSPDTWDERFIRGRR